MIYRFNCILPHEALVLAATALQQNFLLNKLTAQHTQCLCAVLHMACQTLSAKASSVQSV